MTWITENPWPLLILLAGAAIVSLILGDARGRMIALVFVLIAVGLYFLESAIVTPAEEVERGLQTMLNGFLAEDLQAIHNQIADDAPGLRDKAKQGLELVSLDKNFHMQDIVVTVADDQQTAKAELRANGTLTVRQASTPYHAAPRWRTQWSRHRDGWKLSQVQRLNPMTGEEIGVLDAQ
jgi:ketosteroid isomerase-like protein